MAIPKDPYILLSFINTKLRDEYSSLDDLCQNMNIQNKQIENMLASIDYTYSKTQNQFISVIE